MPPPKQAYYPVTDDDGTVYEVPITEQTVQDIQGLSDEEVQPQLRKLYAPELRTLRKKRTATEVGRGIATGAAKAIPSVVGMPGDLQKLYQSAAPQFMRDVTGASPWQVEFPTSKDIYEKGGFKTVRDWVASDPKTSMGKIIEGSPDHHELSAGCLWRGSRCRCRGRFQ
jgi:hypothetical protein